MKRAQPPLIVAALAACLIIACDQSNSSDSSSAKGPDVLTIAGIPKSTGGEFWETVEAGARDAAKDLGIQLKWEGTLAETDIAEQNKIIENMINLGVKGIALAPLNKQAQSKHVKHAVEAGIPVVIFDSEVDGDSHVSFVATDNNAGGIIAGSHMVAALGAQGRVMVQRYVQGAGSTDARAKGFIDTVTSTGIEVVADPYPEDGSVAGAKKTAANTLEGFISGGKLNLNGIFACNLYSALGTLAALDDLRKSGIEIKTVFIGFDSSPKLIDALQDGRCEALVVQNPKRMGYLAVETITRHLRGETVTPFVDTGAKLVTKSKLESNPAIRELVGLQ